jgi:ribosomal protein S18 acetylase RimI-like enzyme
MMLESEPWVTLRFDYKTTLAAIRDKKREVYLARVGGKLAGLVVLNLIGPLRGYVNVIGVWPEWRGRGIGQKLLAFAEARIFRESPNVFLCVSSFNKEAQRLYKRLGYRKVGELKDYVVKGHSEFLMRKTLGPMAEFKTRA